MLIDIQVPYTTQPRMQRNTGPLYNRTPDLKYIEQKKIELEKLGQDLYGETYESTANQLVAKACKHLGLPFKNDIKDLSMLFEEDIAIMHNGKLSAISFCFPSGWIPSQRIGMKLSEIHRPVADSDKLVYASEKLAKTMADPVLGSFKRQVWTVTANKELSNHPVYKSSFVPKSINDLYFRMETQTTEALGDGISSLFFVKVDVIPLVDIWADFGSKIRDSVNSMSASILDYKNLQNIKPLLNKVWLM